jgi:hypothetical protein
LVADRIIAFAEVVGQETSSPHRLQPRRPRPSANRLGQAARSAPRFVSYFEL